MFKPRRDCRPVILGLPAAAHRVLRPHVGTPNDPQRSTSKSTFCSHRTSSNWAAPRARLGYSEAPFLSNPVDCSEADPIWSIAIDSPGTPRARCARLGVPDLSDPNWKTATDPGPPGHRLRGPGLRFPRDRNQTAAGPRPGRRPTSPPALRSTSTSPRPTTRPTPNTDVRTRAPADPAAQGHHGQAAGRAQRSPPPRPTASAPAPTRPPIRPATRSTTTAPSRSSCPDSSKIGTAVALSPLLATPRPDHRRGQRRRADPRRRLPAEAPPRRPASTARTASSAS